MYKHAIGYMTQGIVEMLPRPKFHVIVFKIHNSPEVEDEVSKHIDYHADEVSEDIPRTAHHALALATKNEEKPSNNQEKWGLLLNTGAKKRGKNF